MNTHDSDISNLMATIGGLRSELAEARADAATARADAANQQRHADRFADRLATTLQVCSDLRAERDALAAAAHDALQEATEDAVMCETCLVTLLATDATDPGPTLVATTRAAFPARALLGGDGVPR